MEPTQLGASEYSPPEEGSRMQFPKYCALKMTGRRIRSRIFIVTLMAIIL
jgi:hypothetical protein